MTCIKHGSALFCTCVFEHGFDPSEVTHPQKETGTYVWPHFEYIQICILRSLRPLAHARWVDGRTTDYQNQNWPAVRTTSPPCIQNQFSSQGRCIDCSRFVATAMMLPSSLMETLSVDGCDDGDDAALIVDGDPFGRRL